MTVSKSVGAIKTWNNRAEKLATSAKKIKDASDKLSDIAKTAEAAQRLGQVAGALGVAAVGLEIVMSFMDTGPSDTELVLGAIAKLSDKVTALWDHVDARMAKLEAAGNFNHAQTPIKTLLIDIKVLNELLTEYKDAVASNLQTEAGIIEDQIFKNYDETKLRTIMTRLAQQAVFPVNTSGAQYDHFRQEASVLAACYDLSTGDLDEIAYLNINLIDAYKSCLMAVGIWHAIAWKKTAGGKEFTKEDHDHITNQIADDYGQGFTNICNSMQHWVEHCQTWVSSNIDKRLAQVFTEISVSTGSEPECRASATAIVSRLDSNFSWMGFAVLLYEPMENWKYHGWTGTRLKVFMQQGFKDHSKANILIHFRARADHTISQDEDNWNDFLYFTNMMTREYDMDDVTSILNYDHTIKYRGIINLGWGQTVTGKLNDIIYNNFLLPHTFCQNGGVVHIDHNRNASVASTPGPKRYIPNWWTKKSRFKYFYLG